MSKNYYIYSDSPEPIMKYINERVNNIEYTPLKDLVDKYGANSKFYVEVDSGYYDNEKSFYIMDERLETPKEVEERLVLAKKERERAKKEAAEKRKKTLEAKKKKEDLEYVTYLKLKEKYGDK